MNNPTEKHIRSVHAEFTKIKIYREKILFYDRHFGVISDDFPGFDRSLGLFFKYDETNRLAELFEKERRSAFVHEKRFDVGGEVISFSIAPVNSYPEVLNDFIVSKFLGSDMLFKKTIKQIADNEHGNYSLIEKWYMEAKDNIRLIRNKLTTNNETSLRNQFITVFYQGYTDYVQNEYKKFTRRKKIIELYLYSQGILYAQYMEALSRSMFVPVKAGSHETKLAPSLDLMGKISLFKELGILDLLATKYEADENKDYEKKIAQVVCLILGESLQMSDKILQYIRPSLENSKQQ